MKNKKPILPKKMKMVALIFDSVLPGAKNDFICGIAMFAQKKNDIVLRSIESAEIGRKGVLDGLDGIIVCTIDKDMVETLKATGLPIVILRDTDDPKLIGVSLDVAKSAAMAAEWFLRRGFRNFAYCGIHGISGNVEPDLNEKAFSAAVAKAGCECRIFDEAAVTKNAFGAKHLANLIAGLNAWIPTLPPRTAVLCMHDVRAINVLNVCLRLGRAVPDDIAIMGRANDVALCQCAPVPISSIDINMRGRGYAAIRILANAIDNPVKAKSRPAFLVPPVGIVERASTNTYPVNPPYLAKALLLIDENIERNISMQELTEAVGVSRTTLQDAFRKTLGMSAKKYMLSVKMREARRLTEGGRLSIKEIAARIGFSSGSHFSRTYHNFFGRSPKRDARMSIA